MEHTPESYLRARQILAAANLARIEERRWPADARRGAYDYTTLELVVPISEAPALATRLVSLAIETGAYLVMNVHETTVRYELAVSCDVEQAGAAAPSAEGAGLPLDAEAAHAHAFVPADGVDALRCVCGEEVPF